MVRIMIIFCPYSNPLLSQNPAFGQVQVRELTPIFVEKAIQVGLAASIQIREERNNVLRLASRYMGFRICQE